jgi:hypothetical protein
MSGVGEFVDKTGDLILRLWERGQNFLWAVASAGAAVFLILLAGWWFGIGNGADLFEAYAFPALILAIVGGIFGVWRKLEDRPKPTVFLIAEVGQSFWAQSRQSDGRVTTQFCLRMQATNLTNGPIKLSGVRLIRPRIKRSDDELARHVITQHPENDVYGFDFPIMPKAVSKASCVLIVDRPIGDLGTSITAVAAVSDQHGRWHKVKFEKLRGMNQGPV